MAIFQTEFPRVIDCQRLIEPTKYKQAIFLQQVGDSIKFFFFFNLRRLPQHVLTKERRKQNCQ